MNLDEFADDSEATDYLRDLWESHASWWQREFTDGKDVEYVEQIVPLILDRVGVGGLVADVGGGEGQIARALVTTRGSRVVVVEPSLAQARVASERGGGVTVVRGTAGSLPLGSGTVDTVVVCLVFEHILDVAGALTEVSRVLKPSGEFLFLLNHPLLQTPGSGLIDDVELGERYWRLGPYLQEDLTVEEVAHGVFIPFVHRPLSHYLNAAIAAKLSLVEMTEPSPPPGFLATAAAIPELAAFPRLLALRFIKVGGSA